MWVINLSTWWMTGVMGIILYWLPLATCAVVYMVKGYKKYQDQLVLRSNGEWFQEHDFTLGHILGGIFLCVCPVINLIAFLRECAWDVLRWIGNKFEKFFTFPLVRDSAGWKAKRDEMKKRKHEEWLKSLKNQ